MVPGWTLNTVFLFIEQIMSELINLVLRAGHSALDVALYTLLPVMVVMMIMMRFLERYGVIDWLVAIIGPLLKPFGLTGLSVLAMIQMSLVSFVAPLPTLAMMEDRGVADRKLSAATAAMLAMAPANALFPVAALGASAGAGILLSVLGGLPLQAAVTTFLVAGFPVWTCCPPRSKKRCSRIPLF